MPALAWSAPQEQGDVYGRPGGGIALGQSGRQQPGILQSISDLPLWEHLYVGFRAKAERQDAVVIAVRNDPRSAPLACPSERQALLEDWKPVHARLAIAIRRTFGRISIEKGGDGLG